MDDVHAARIRALDDAWTVAAERRDLDAMLAIYAPDAEELLPGLPPITGRDEIRSFYARLMSEFPRFKHEFSPDTILVSGSADLAVVRGRFRFTPDANEPDVVQVGKFVGVWKWIGGDWRLKYNVSNEG